jgi:hypothetical protein
MHRRRKNESVATRCQMGNELESANDDKNHQLVTEISS